MESAVFPGQYDNLVSQAGSFLYRKGGQFKLASATCKAASIK